MILDEGMNEDNIEEYFEDIWGNELFIDAYSSNELIKTFTSAYEKSLISNVLEIHPKLFYQNLAYPSILWNKDAEAFIKKHKLTKFPIHHSTEVYDSSCGFVIINEYALSYDVSSSDRVDSEYF